MKFGKTILAQQLPEYSAYYINYKALKKIIKSLAAGSEHETVSDGEGRLQTRLQENKATFFFKLERELDKVNAFYLQKESELRNRLNTLLDKKKLLTAGGGTDSRASAGFVILQEGFQQFERDLNKLQQYVDLNATGFYKALKKWDKRSKSHTKELYLSRRVEIQPVFNREVLSNLVDTATAALLDLEAFANGEELPVDRTGETRSPDLKALLVRAQDEIDSDILKSVLNESPGSLREILTKLGGQSVEETRPRVTRIFMQAMAGASEESLNVLVESKLIDFAYRNEISGRLCLHEAILAGRLFPLNVCLAHDSDVKHADVYGRTALHYACMHGRKSAQVVGLLLDRGAPVNVLDHNNSTPLHYAILGDNREYVKILLERGANVNPVAESDWNPLSMACMRGSLALTETLLEHGAKPAYNAEGLLPIHLVARAGHTGFCAVLEKFGLDLEARDKFNGWTPIFFAASEGHLDVLRELIEYGAMIDVRDEDRHSPVYHAAWEGHNATLQALLSAGGAFGNTESNLRRPVAPPPPPVNLTDLPELSMEDDGIPSLLLPPPILPVRSYGHNYLDRTTLIQVLLSGPTAIKRSPVTWYLDETLFSSSKLTVSLKSTTRQTCAEVIPQTVSLPLLDNAESLVFHIDDLRHLCLEFEIYPTFGSKVIAKAVAPPSLLTDLPSRGRTLGLCQLPLLDPRLQVIGQLSLEYLVIRPFAGVHFDIHSRIETYWKSTQTIESGNQKAQTQQNLVTSSSLAGSYASIPVQLSRDFVPFVSAAFKICIAGIDFGIHSLTAATLTSLQQQDSAIEEVSGRLSRCSGAGEVRDALNGACVPLSVVLEATPPTVNLNLHIIMPTRAEQMHLGIDVSSDVNGLVDAILKDTFAHADAVKSVTPRQIPRSLYFSSCNATICTALNWKQPNYPVFFASYAGQLNASASRHATAMLSPHGLEIVDEDRSCRSIKEAVKFSKANNLLGLVLDADVAIHAPALITTVKESGLVLITNGEVNVNRLNVDTQISHGVDGVMHRGVCQFVNEIDM